MKKTRKPKNADEARKMKEFFLALWDEREELEVEDGWYVKCFESGQYLQRHIYRENSACYSHILSKSQYPEYKYENWNVEIVNPNWHNQYEVAPERAPKQYQRKKELLKAIYDKK